MKRVSIKYLVKEAEYFVGQIHEENTSSSNSNYEFAVYFWKYTYLLLTMGEGGGWAFQTEGLQDSPAGFFLFESHI